MANVIDLKKHPDNKDFGPRVGFVFDPFGKGKTVLRGGYGIYYDRIILEAGAEELVQNDRALTVTQYAVQLHLALCARPSEPGRMLRSGRQLSPPAARPSPALSADRIRPGGVGILAMGPDAHHPLFQQFSLGRAAAGRQ